MSLEPWKEYGLTRGAYYYRVKNNIPLDALVGKGRTGERYSGKSYRNPSEKIEELKRKYANGITPEILDELLR